ncbi:hypothetical protein K7432_013180 [Basidiobolus ranarum]|uniref:Myb-like domain-containing protein n=1 Tax=Basidiobolus ranarum TaxID=34480 RepID=A0ABR2VRU1_9FUNG
MTLSEDHAEINTSHDSLNFDTSNFKQPTFWSHEETKLLIILRQERNALFLSMKRPRKLWAEIAAVLQTRGFDKSSEQCHQKWKNMLRSFREVDEYNSKVIPAEKKKCSFYDEISDFYNKTRFDSPKPSDADDRVSPDSEGKVDISDTPLSSHSDFQNHSLSVPVFDTTSSPSNISIGSSISISNSHNHPKAASNGTARPKRSSDGILTPLHSKAMRIQQEDFDASIPQEKLLNEFRLLTDHHNSLNTAYHSPLPQKFNSGSHTSNGASELNEDMVNSGSKEDMERFFNFYREQSLRMNTGAEKARENFRYTLEVIENLAKDFAEKEHQYADRQARMFEKFVEALRKD